MQPKNVKPTQFLEFSRIALEREHKVKLDPRTLNVQVYCFPKTINNKRFNEFTSSVMFVGAHHEGKLIRIDYENLSKYNLSFISFPGKINRPDNETFSFYTDYFRIIISPPSGLNRFVSYVASKQANEPDKYIQKFVTPFTVTEEEIPDDLLDDIDYN